MRYRELLESPNAYLPMFNGIPVDKVTLVNHIRKVEEGLKRQDRIQWFLKWSRVWFLDQTQNDQPVDERLQRKIHAAVQNQYADSWSDAVHAAGEALENFDAYVHYVNMKGVKAIQDLEWTNQTPYDLVHRLADMEERYIAQLQKSESRTVTPIRNDQILIDFGNGWAWWLLDRGFCQAEADAMGHCGNAGMRGGERIISLRKHVHDKYWDPRLTFILDHKGYLGEMKGRGNDKPSASYHRYITALLLNPIVKGIKGGGYLPENNFRLSDLTAEELESLLAQKPELTPLDEVYWKWRHENDPAEKATLFEMLKPKLEAAVSRFGYEDIDWSRMRIIISKYDPASFVRNHAGEFCSRLYDFLTWRLSVILEDIPNGEEIAEQVEAQYLKPLFGETINVGTEFQVDGVHRQYDPAENAVETILSIRDFIADEREALDRVKSLDDEDDNYYYGDDDYLSNIDTDDLGRAILFHVSKDDDRTSEKLKAAILARYVR